MDLDGIIKTELLDGSTGITTGLFQFFEDIIDGELTNGFADVLLLIDLLAQFSLV